jgi:hypothetical protein
VDQYQTGDNIVFANGARLLSSNRGGDRKSDEFCNGGGSGSTATPPTSEELLASMLKHLTQDEGWLKSATRTELVLYIVKSEEKHVKQLGKHAAAMRQSPAQKTLLSFFKPKNPKDRTSPKATRPPAKAAGKKTQKGTSVWTLRRRTATLCKHLEEMCGGDLNEQVCVVDMLATQFFGREDVGRMSPEDRADNEKNSAVVAALARNFLQLLQLYFVCTISSFC